MSQEFGIIWDSEEELLDEVIFDMVVEFTYIFYFIIHTMNLLHHKT